MDDAYVPAQSYATLGIFHINLLHPKSVIDQAWETRRALALAAAFQFCGHYTTQKSWYALQMYGGLLVNIYAARSVDYGIYIVMYYTIP